MSTLDFKIGFKKPLTMFVFINKNHKFCNICKNSFLDESVWQFIINIESSCSREKHYHQRLRKNLFIRHCYYYNYSEILTFVKKGFHMFYTCLSSFATITFILFLSCWLVCVVLICTNLFVNIWRSCNRNF